MDLSNFKSGFASDYKTSRTMFREACGKQYGKVKALPIIDDCTIDLFCREGTDKKKLLFITSGQHGIEGYVGAGLIQCFIKEYLPNLDASIGIVLIHGMNPWGMKHYRKTNEHNVDLNRNFMVDFTKAAADANPFYLKAAKLFQPARGYRHSFLETIRFVGSTVSLLMKMGMGNIEKAMTLGQFVCDKGLYYGGHEDEPATAIMKALYQEYFTKYEEVILLDMHTGYGPANHMSIVNSRFEKQSSKEMKENFQYPDVVKSDAQEFYEIYGDEIDYLYQTFPDKKMYAATFEFGTLGNDIMGYIRTLKAIVNENQAYFYGTGNERQKQSIKEAYQKLYQPMDDAFYQAIYPQFVKAMDGILKYYQYIK